MTDSYRKMGSLTGKVALFTVPVICLLFGSAKGNSRKLLTSLSGNFQSPGYPDLDDNKQCTWEIALPQYYRITITFIDFDLLTRNICQDKVEIYDGNIKKGTYVRRQLNGRSITSSSNTMIVVLKSCSPSLLQDRRGFSASYFSDYPTTPVYRTSKRVITTPAPATTTISTEGTSNFTVRRATIPALSKVSTISTVSSKSVELSTGLLYSNDYSEQVFPDPAVGSRSPLSALLAGLFVSFLFFLIIAIVIVKRKRAKQSSIATTTPASNTDANNDQVNSSSIVAESTAETNFLSEYNCVYGPDIRNMNKNVRLEGSRVIFSPKLSSPRLKKKQPIFSRDNDTCVYENNASDIYNNTDFYEDYGVVSGTVEQASPKVENDEGQRQPKCSDMNSTEGVVFNTVYEPYVPET